MFNSISLRRPKLNKFDMSHDVKLSCNMGDLIPILCEEVVPGDRWRVNSEIMMRLAPMLAPVMHRVDVWTHYFFVPNRILWDSWEDFITGGVDGLQAPVHPTYTLDGLRLNSGINVPGTLPDYLGIPIVDGATVVPKLVSALPFRAYTEIFNEYYRDQTIRTAIANPKTSGAQTNYEPTFLRRRAWEKDYFTSALPFAQRGNPVTIPNVINYLDETNIFELDDTPAGQLLLNSGGSLDSTSPPAITNTGRVENIDDITIDLNDLRRSNALQKWLEKAARGGSRYTEQLLSFFGVNSGDARLQRPEYLGGGKQNIVISEVLQTSEAGGTPLAEMAGHGVSVGATNRFQHRFVEHGYIMGIMSVLPRTAYTQGVPRSWTRFDKFDYYFPEFAHLGEQEILKDEIFYDKNGIVGSETFAYQSRYAEYKHRSGRVHGDMRDTLDFWHMARTFTGVPGFNTNFVECIPTHRIFANQVTTDHKLWVQIYNQVSALRPMPYYADPHL